MEFLSGVFPVYENHCHGAFKSSVKTHNEVDFLSLRQLNLQVLDTLELLGFLFNGEILEVADDTASKLDDLVRESG